MPACRPTVVYLSHGGGPLPLLGDPGHAALVAFLQGLPARLERPEAILVVSAHWEEPVATVQGAARPPMLFDYHGFPEEAYRLDYPAPGHPELAGRIAGRLREQGLAARIDDGRGFDHGLFVPLMLMAPDAEIPALQLSLLSSLDPAAHLALGRALRELGEDRLLVVGSGFSYHNLRAFFSRDPGAPDPENEAFQDWLVGTCTGDLPQAERERRLLEWERAPGARRCHPREEHLLPLHVCAGLAEGPSELVFDDRVFGKRCVAFLWGGDGEREAET